MRLYYNPQTQQCRPRFDSSVDPFCLWCWRFYCLRQEKIFTQSHMGKNFSIGNLYKMAQRENGSKVSPVILSILHLSFGGTGEFLALTWNQFVALCWLVQETSPTLFKNKWQHICQVSCHNYSDSYTSQVNRPSEFKYFRLGWHEDVLNVSVTTFFHNAPQARTQRPSGCLDVTSEWTKTARGSKSSHPWCTFVSWSKVVTERSLGWAILGTMVPSKYKLWNLSCSLNNFVMTKHKTFILCK